MKTIITFKPSGQPSRAFEVLKFGSYETTPMSEFKLKIMEEQPVFIQFINKFRMACGWPHLMACEVRLSGEYIAGMCDPSIIELTLNIAGESEVSEYFRPFLDGVAECELTWMPSMVGARYSLILLTYEVCGDTVTISGRAAGQIVWADK